MTKRKLTAKQERFKNCFIEGMDAKAAYIRAGYKARGSAAEAAASRLLRNVKVRSAIEEVQKRAAEKAEVTCGRIIGEYARIAFFNIKQLYDGKGNPKKIDELDYNTAAAIAGIDVLHKKTQSSEIYTTKKIRLNDKIRALDSLARIQGMFNDKLVLGFTAETLKAILAGLPDEFSAGVRESLAKLVSSRRG